MRLIVGLISVFVLLVAPSLAEDAKQWKTWTCKEGGFTVLTLGEPQQSDVESSMENAKGKAHLAQFMVGQTGCTANYVDFLPGILDTPLKEFYDTFRDRSTSELDGLVISEKEIKLGEHPGREIVIEINGGKYFYRDCYILIGQRLYQQSMLGTKEAVNSKEAEAFLNSLKLIDKIGKKEER